MMGGKKQTRGEVKETERHTHHVQPYLIPEDGVLFIATYRQGVALETQVH